MAPLYALSPAAIFKQLRAEHVSFWLICFYLLFEYVRPQTIYPAINFFPWSAFFAAGALLSSFSDRASKVSSNTVSKLIVFYGLVVLLSSIFAYNPSRSFEHLSDYFNWLIIYFAIVRTVKSRTRYFIFFLLYMLCNFKMSQHGFRSWVGMGFKFDIDGIGGSPGWFQNSGEFGIQLCIFTPLIVAFTLAVKSYCSKLIRLGIYAAPITAIASVVGSSSRGALVGLVLSGLWSIKTSKYFIRTLLAGGLILGLIYIAIPPESKERFESSGQDKTSIHRLDRWKKGWETMKEHPLLGIGHKNWELYYSEHLNYGVPGTPLVHNIFVESGTEHGFLGLGTLVFIFISMFKVTRRIRAIARQQSDTFSIYIAHGLDAANIGLIVSASFVTVLYYPYVWIQAAFVSSLYSSVMQPARKS